jgi:hypothetical protein
VENIQLKLTFRDVLGYILAYLFWMVAAAASMLAAFELRTGLNVIWPALGSGVRWAWTLRAVDRFGLVFLGLIWLAYSIFCEHYYRSAITEVRFRDFRGKKAPALQSDRASWAARFLARMGLDILAYRIAITVAPAVGVWLIGFLVMQLGFWLLLR